MRRFFACTSMYMPTGGCSASNAKIIALLIAVGLTAPAMAKAVPPRKPAPLTYSKKQDFIARIVRMKLIDPDSAIFSAIKVCSFDETSKMAMGIVNSKNRFGGYAGNKPFYYLESNGTNEVAFAADNMDEYLSLTEEEREISRKVPEVCGRLTAQDMIQR